MIPPRSAADLPRGHGWRGMVRGATLMLCLMLAPPLVELVAADELDIPALRAVVLLAIDEIDVVVTSGEAAIERLDADLSTADDDAERARIVGAIARWEEVLAALEDQRATMLDRLDELEEAGAAPSAGSEPGDDG